MISFFRSIFSSKIGLFLTLAFVGLIAIAFATADVSGSGTFGGVTGSGTAAEVGDMKLTTAELSQSVNNAFRAQQRQNTGLDMATFIEGGGYDGVLDRLINSFAIAAFGQRYGMSAGKRLVDGEIASIQAFQGADGQFSETNFRSALQQQNIQEQQLRDDLARNLIADQLLPLASFGTVVPRTMVAPYASLLLEERGGRIAIIPSAAFVERAEPAAAALAAFYSRNSSRYTIPERRSISYALFSRERFAERVKPTQREIEGYYRLNREQYAATETRNVDQVILPTEAAANALANKVRAGTSLAQAAKSVGLSAAELGSVSENSLADTASQAVANAVFATPPGKISAPAQSGLGWHVARVRGVDRTAGKSLAEARTEIVNELTRDKVEEALAELTVTMEEEFAAGSSLAEVAAAEKLKVERTPLLLANGRNPRDPDYQPIPEMERILPLAFSLEENTEPQVVEIIPGQQYAIMEVNEVRGAAPPPLAQIRQQVARDYLLNAASKRAKKVADTIASKVARGTPLAKAMADAKVKLPAPESVNATRADLARQSQQGGVPPPLSLLFSMAENTAKTLKAPQDQGWFVVSLNEIVEGDASNRKDLLDATTQQFQGVLQNEYAEQFIAAMKADVGVERNDSALATERDRLLGRNPGGL